RDPGPREWAVAVGGETHQRPDLSVLDEVPDAEHVGQPEPDAQQPRKHARAAHVRGAPSPRPAVARRELIRGLARHTGTVWPTVGPCHPAGPRGGPPGGRAGTR